MKKTALIFTFMLMASLPRIGLCASATDAGPYDAGQEVQSNSDKEVKQKKQESVTETSLKNRVLGSFEDFVNETMELFGLQTTPESVNNALSSEEGGNKDGLPEGEEGSNFFKETLLPPQDAEGTSNKEAAGLTESSKSQKKRERALVETATFGYALAAIHKTQAARNLTAKTSIDQKATNQTNTTRNYGSTVSNNTSIKMSTAQIYNALILTTATNNMLSAISSAEYISNTNNILADVLTSALSAAAGGLIGSALD